MGGRKQLAGPTAQMTVTLASFPVSDTTDSSDLSVDTPVSCTLTIYVGGNLYLRISCSIYL
jgi:hypothetical protein